jgi:phosphate transport system substrate-binding protein
MQLTRGRLFLLLSLLAITAFAAAFAACGGDDDNGGATIAPGASTPASSKCDASGEVSIEGSSTVQPFTLELIDAFADACPDVTVNPPSGLGSGAGITAFINKDVDVAQSSRNIKADEVTQAEAAGLDPFETEILKDALAITVNPDNPVQSLTLEQVAKIFAGQITDWSEVGGNAGKITIYTRNEESGTFVYMEDDVIKKVLGKEASYADDINKQANAPAGLSAVAGDESAIFYAGLGNLSEVPAGSVKVVKVGKDASATAVEPSEETVSDGSYPISRGLYYYTSGDPAKSDNPAVTAFIDFALSPEGQSIGEDLGFLPVGPTS